MTGVLLEKGEGDLKHRDMGVGGNVKTEEEVGGRIQKARGAQGC